MVILISAVFSIVVIAFLFMLCLKTLYKPKVKSIIILLLIAVLVFCFFKFQQFFNVVWFIANTLHASLLIYLVTYTCTGLLISRKKQTYSARKNNIKISIIIAAHNEEEVIDYTLKKIIDLNYDKKLLEVVIIDDNSTDNTLNVLRHYKDKIKVIERKNTINFGKPAALNEIIPSLSSELFCIFDADSLPESDFLHKCAAYFSDSSVAIVQARNKQYNENNTLISKLTSIDIDALHLNVYKGKSTINGMQVFEGRGAMIRKSSFINLGGFNTELPTEDLDFGFRCQSYGFKVLYDENIHNYEQTVESPSQYYNQRNRWLTSTVLTYFENLQKVLISKTLTNLQKLDFQFMGSFITWALCLNLLGFMTIIAYIQDFSISSTFYITIFIFIELFYLFPAFKARKKASDLLYLPLMYIYAWSYSIIIFWFIGRRFFLNEKVLFKKSNHFSLSFKNTFFK